MQKYRTREESRRENDKFRPQSTKTCTASRRPIFPQNKETGDLLQMDGICVRLGRRAFFVLTVVDKVIDHAGVGQGRGIPQIAVLVLGDLAQNAAHDLA